jgi:hypothetical protein
MILIAISILSADEAFKNIMLNVKDYSSKSHFSNQPTPISDVFAVRPTVKKSYFRK